MLKNEQTQVYSLKISSILKISSRGIVKISAKFNKFNPYFSNIFLIKVLTI